MSEDSRKIMLRTVCCCAQEASSALRPAGGLHAAGPIALLAGALSWGLYIAGLW